MASGGKMPGAEADGLATVVHAEGFRPCCHKRAELCADWDAFLNEDERLPLDYEQRELVWSHGVEHPLCSKCDHVVGSWPLPMMNVPDWLSSTFVHAYGLQHLASNDDRFTRSISEYLVYWLAGDGLHEYSTRPCMLWLLIHAGHRPDSALRWVSSLWCSMGTRRALPDNWAECVHMLECTTRDVKEFDDVLLVAKTYAISLIRSAAKQSFHTKLKIENAETLELRHVAEGPEEVAQVLHKALVALRALITESAELTPQQKANLYKELGRRTHLAFSYHAYGTLFDEEHAVRLMAFWNAAHRAIKDSGIFSSLPDSDWWNGEGFLGLALWTDDIEFLESLAYALRHAWVQEIPPGAPRHTWTELAVLRMWKCSHLRYAHYQQDEEFSDERAPKLIGRRRTYAAGLAVQLLRSAAFCPLRRLRAEALNPEAGQKYHAMVDKLVPGWRFWDLQ
jgi:hypothetical protein